MFVTIYIKTAITCNFISNARIELNRKIAFSASLFKLLVQRFSPYSGIDWQGSQGIVSPNRTPDLTSIPPFAPMMRRNARDFIKTKEKRHDSSKSMDLYTVPQKPLWVYRSKFIPGR